MSKAQCSQNPSVQFGTVSAVPASSNACYYNTACFSPCYFISQSNSWPFSANWPSTLSTYANNYIPVSFDPSSGGPGTYSGSPSATYYSSTAGSYITVSIAASGQYVAYGSIYPKYQVLAVWYAPPGSHSSVNYGSSTAMGVSKSWDNSFSSSTTVTTSFTGGIPIVGSLTSTTSNTWSQQEDDSHSISANKTTSVGYTVSGPISDDVGIDHDYDQIVIWLNPAANFTLTGSNTAQWDYQFDQRDANEVDPIFLYVKDLKALQNGTFTGDPNIPQRLARTWAQNSDDGSGPGLTSADYAAILARDPLANGQTTIDPTRFDLQGGQTFQYLPPACGGQPVTTTYNVQYATTSTQGQSATDTYTLSYGTSKQAAFQNFLTANATFTSSKTLTWTNKWGHQTSSGTGQTATATITGPSACTYTGKTDVQMYRDNVYGTFMFAFVN